MKASSPSATESEITFVVCAERPREILEQIGRAISLEGLRVEHAGSRHIHDCYFDTSGRLLQQSHRALRIRKIGSERLITLKGPGTVTSWGGVTRAEYEAPWSQEALRVIAGELAGDCIALPCDLNWLDAAVPTEVLARLGLEKIQDRETVRQVIEITVKSGEKRTSVAEVDLDAVIYSFRDRKIRHHEIEIEAKGEENQHVLTIVAQELVAAHRSHIRRWDHSKLATGLAVEELLLTGGLTISEKDHDLTPGDYDEIEAFLRR